MGGQPVEPALFTCTYLVCILEENSHTGGTKFFTDHKQELLLLSA